MATRGLSDEPEGSSRPWEVTVMIAIQLALYCALFTLMVKIGVGDNALNGLFFYPRPVQERVYALGLTDPATVARRRKRFMIAFLGVMAAALCAWQNQVPMGAIPRPFMLETARPCSVRSRE